MSDGVDPVPSVLLREDEFIVVHVFTADVKLLLVCLFTHRKGEWKKFTVQG